jgi:hypothetical protein
MWHIVFNGLIIFYLVMLMLLFTRWLAFLQQEENLSTQAQFNLIMFLLIAAILWPLIVPISYLKLLDNQQKIHNL